MGRGEMSWRCARFGGGSRHDKMKGMARAEYESN